MITCLQVTCRHGLTAMCGIRLWYRRFGSEENFYFLEIMENEAPIRLPAVSSVPMIRLSARHRTAAARRLRNVSAGWWAIALIWLSGIFWLSGGFLDAKAQGWQGAGEVVGDRSATLLPVELPLDAGREQRLLSSLESLANRPTGADRQIVVLEFRRAVSTSAAGGEETVLGRGTPFERALSVARWLAGPRGARLQTVAFLPESIAGHAVLIALGCEEIAMPLDAEFGQAGIEEVTLDATVRQAYLDIASRRGNVLPAAAVLSMLDPSEPLTRIDHVDGKIEYVTASQLAERERKAGEWKEEQLVPNNQLGWFRGQELRSWRWIAYAASDREQLASALRLTKPPIEQPTFDGPRVVVRTQLSGILSPRHVDRMLRALEQGLADGKANLVLIELDTPGGSLVESLRLAHYLAEIPATKAEVVCYIRNAARGDAALVALACDALFMHPNAVLGGPGEASISPEQCSEQRPSIESLARSSGRSVGELLGCLSNEIPIFEYTAFDGRSQWNSPEWLVDDPQVAQWTQGAPVSFEGGLTFDEARELRLVVDSPESIELVGSRYGVETLPVPLKTNATEQFIDWLASQLWISFLLFTIGITALSAELSSPGVGFPGILAAICFGLFFWLRFLDGTVEWLEVMLILGGIACLLVEIFLLPGFGVFGVTGLGMLAIGLVLAGQTFVWPTNDYQRGRLVQGFGQIGLVTFSLLALGILFRKQIANSPFVRWMVLPPPARDVDREKKQEVEAEVRAFVGWKGMTTTRCNPHGRAMVGDRMWNVVCEEGWIDEDTEVVVVAAKDQQLVVRKNG